MADGRKSPLSSPVHRPNSDSDSTESLVSSQISSTVLTTPSTARKTSPATSPESSTDGTPMSKKRRTWEVHSLTGKPGGTTQRYRVLRALFDEEDARDDDLTGPNEPSDIVGSPEHTVEVSNEGSSDDSSSDTSTTSSDSSSVPTSYSDSESDSDSTGDSSSIPSSVDSGSDSNSDNELQNDEDVKLFNGSDRTVDEAVCDILKDYFKNRETQVSLKDHLNTFLKYLPQPNNMPKPVKQLFKYVDNLDPSFKEVEYPYCSKCHIAIKDKSLEKCNVCGSTSRGSFFMFSLEDQLRHQLENCGLARELDKVIARRNDRQDNVIRDICDGSEYKRLNVEGYDLTLMWFTDGVSVTRSSLWPIYYVICELPFHLRRLYIGVCGAWCDKSKPVMNCFLDPFATALKDLNDKGGMIWNHPETGQQCTSVIRAPLASADAPARADLQVIQGPNAKYACNTCEQKTSRVPLTEAEIQAKERGARVQVRRAFIYSETAPKLRTHIRMKKQAKRAVKKKAIIKGVKGSAVSQIIPELDLSTFVFAENMHGVCLGLVKLLQRLWFTIPGPWSLKIHESEVDEFIENIRPTSEISRIMKGVSHFPKWKANECRQWLLFGSLIALKDYLNSVCLQHYILFVVAIYNLLKEEVTVPDLESSEKMLRLFVRDIEELYRGRDCVYNVHQLLHLCLYVRRWGPLSHTSAFLFEDYNGTLIQMIHGTRNKTKELAYCLRQTHGLQILCNKVLKN